MNSISQNEFYDLRVILNIKIHKKFLSVINNEIPTMIKRLIKRRFIFNKCSKYCLSSPISSPPRAIRLTSTSIFPRGVARLPL